MPTNVSGGFVVVTGLSHKYIPRGRYKIITFVDGLREDQEDFLATMMDVEVKKMHLIDLAQDGGMDGAVIEHVASGTFYKIELSQFVMIQKPAGAQYALQTLK